MTHSIRTLMVALTAALLIPAAAARAQASQRGQPTTPFAAADLAKLRWLEGTWEATSPGEPSIYERYHFANDSLIEITYYGDRGMSRETGNGRVYLSVGRVYHTFGPGRWGATHVDNDGVYFVPQVNARNTFAWTRQSAEEWTSTLRSGVSGHDRVTVYQMKRLQHQ